MPKEKICKEKVHEVPVIGRRGLHPVKVIKVLDNTAVVEMQDAPITEMGLVYLDELHQKKEKKNKSKDPMRPFSFR